MNSFQATHPCALLLLAGLIRYVGDPVHGLVELRAGVPAMADIATPRTAVRPALPLTGGQYITGRRRRWRRGTSSAGGRCCCRCCSCCGGRSTWAAGGHSCCCCCCRCCGCGGSLLLLLLLLVVMVVVH